MISLDYLVFYCAYLSILLLVFASVSDFCEKLKERIWEYNKKEIMNIFDLYCKKAKIFGVDQKIEIFSYKNFSYNNECGLFNIKKGQNIYLIKHKKLYW